MIQAFFEYSFVRNAVAAAFLASIVVGIIGTIAIEKKLISMSGGIAHASFGGIGLGYLLGIEPIIGGIAFAVASSALISNLPERSKMRADTMTGILWSFGMALGIVFIALAPGYMPDMTSYLFGDILAVSNQYLLYIAIFTAIIILIFVLTYRHMILYLFDERFAVARGINTHVLKMIVYMMLPIGIIVLLKVVGIVLTIALMTIPVSLAKLLFRSVGKVILASMAISFLLCMAGLAVSFHVSIPSGACIVVLAAVCYFIALVAVNLIKKLLHSHKEHH